jgi:hypothetical protein
LVRSIVAATSLTASQPKRGGTVQTGRALGTTTTARRSPFRRRRTAWYNVDMQEEVIKASDLIPVDAIASDRAMALAVRNLNAPLAHPVDPDRALDWLRNRSWTTVESHHARALLDETDEHVLMDLVLAGAVTYARLAACADALLPPTHETRVWLCERRHG